MTTELTVRQASVPVASMAEMERLAQAIAKSGLFAMKTADQALALMAISQANGEHPARACQQYSIIQGRAAMTAQTMQARFQEAGGTIRWVIRNDTEASADFSHPAGGTLRILWTLEDAKRIGLAGRDNWKNYPRQKLSARVVSEGVRAVLPGVILGFFAPEEIEGTGAGQSDPSVGARNVTAEVAPAPALFPKREATPETGTAERETVVGEALVLVSEPVAPTVPAKSVTNATPEARMSALADMIGDDAGAANSILAEKGWIADGQTFFDLEPGRVAQILASPERFLRAVATAAGKGGAK